MPRAFSLKFALLGLLAFSGCLAASCDERGSTSICPVLPLYQTFPLGDAAPADAASADSSDVRVALEAAYDSGCLTRPSQFPYDASAGASGEGADSAGLGGKGAGGGAAAHAGAAGGR